MIMTCQTTYAVCGHMYGMFVRGRRIAVTRIAGKRISACPRHCGMTTVGTVFRTVKTGYSVAYVYVAVAVVAAERRAVKVSIRMTLRAFRHVRIVIHVLAVLAR